MKISDMQKYFNRCSKNKFVIESEKLRVIAESKKATKEDKNRYDESKREAIKACFDILDDINLGAYKEKIEKECKCGNCKCDSKNKNKEKKHGKKK